MLRFRRKAIYRATLMVVLALSAGFVLASTVSNLTTSYQSGYVGVVSNVPGIGSVTYQLQTGTENTILGSLASTCPTSPGISTLAYDNQDGYVYVICNGNILAISQSTGAVVHTLAAAGANQAAYVPSTGQLWVTDSTGTTVYIVNAPSDTLANTVALATNGVGDGVAYDSASGNVYVVDVAMSQVQLFNAGTLASAGTVTGFSYPMGAVYDSGNNEVYVDEQSSICSSNVIPISGTTAQSSITVGAGNSYQMAYDPATNEIYVPDLETLSLNCASEVSAIADGTGLVTNIALTNIYSDSAVFDPLNGEVYLLDTGAFSSTKGITILDAPAHAVVTTLGGFAGGSSAVFDPENDLIYADEYGSSGGNDLLAEVSGVPLVYSATPTVLLGNSGVATVCAAGGGCTGGDPTEQVTIAYTMQSSPGQSFSVQVTASGAGATYLGGTDLFSDAGTQAGQTLYIVVNLDLGAPGGGQSVSSVSVVINA